MKGVMAQRRTSGGSPDRAKIGRGGLRVMAVTGIVSVAALAGCGGPPAILLKTRPQTIELRVGHEVTVHKSAGECGSPWSTAPRVIRARQPPPAGDCSPASVAFKAVGIGTAQIVGQVPCHVPACAAAGARITVHVRRS